MFPTHRTGELKALEVKRKRKNVERSRPHTPLLALTSAPSSTSRAAVSVCPFRAALCSGVVPSGSYLTASPAGWDTGHVILTEAVEALDEKLTRKSGERSRPHTSSLALTSAPSSTSRAAVSVCPFSAAWCSGVLPSGPCPTASPASWDTGHATLTEAVEALDEKLTRKSGERSHPHTSSLALTSAPSSTSRAAVSV